MGYKIAFYCAAGLFVVLLAILWSIGIWANDSFWSEANKYGIVFTIIGTLFAFGTFCYVGMFADRLKKKHRIPETHDDLVLLLRDVREGLKDWSGRQNDVIDLLHQIRGHLENVSQKLDGVEKKSADRLASSISRSSVWYVFRRDITEYEGWKIQRQLHNFVTLLRAKHQDNEVERV
jgi:hypothetical protein